MEKIIISISLWGKTKKEQKWDEWYEDVKKLADSIGINMTHLGIRSTNYSSSKILTIRRKEKDILECIKKGEKIDSFSVYSLPENYQIASFDYDLYIVRNMSFISISMKEKYYNSLIEQRFILSMNKYIDFETGEVFSTSDKEVPLIYTATRDKSNLETFESIKIIK